MRKSIKSIFLTGIAAIIPVGVTVYILILIIKVMNNLVRIIPYRYQPDQLLPFHVPGLGIVFTVVLIFIVGLVTRSYLGRKLVTLGEVIVDKIPLVRGIYKAVKKLVEAIMSDKSTSFRKVVLIEYPRRGLYSIAFVTGDAKGEVREKTTHNAMNLFVPTTPNPTSGFYIVISESDVIPLTMTVEEAFALIMSGGILTPPDASEKAEKKRKKHKEERKIEYVNNV
jgi:uncharacterized membrane protein